MLINLGNQLTMSTLRSFNLALTLEYVSWATCVTKMKMVDGHIKKGIPQNEILKLAMHDEHVKGKAVKSNYSMHAIKYCIHGAPIILAADTYMQLFFFLFL